MGHLFRISILTDNCAGSYTMAEHGLSYLIEYDGCCILFDTGQSDLFKTNAATMNINLENSVDLIVLSHGHFDHGNGLAFISGNRLLCHPGCFETRFSAKDHRYIGLNRTSDQLASSFNLITSESHYRISDLIYFLGEIPRNTDFESKTTTFVFNDRTPDFVMDDSALALILPEGLFVVTGCGHAGIVNTLEHARKVTGINSIYGIMGGFHLKEINPQLKETVKYLKENNVKNILPAHCTALPALSYFYSHFRISQVRTGDILTF
ncbi:MAG TPA: MBL fold metallo-hydrolase [Bacteroidales bacterium]|nr:MBL fold metallo-hydrolase [Bacteroidales bacterium]